MQQERLALEVHEDEKFGKKLKDFPKSVLVVLRNTTFIFLSLAGVTSGLIIQGMSAFLPKILESLFMLTSAFSSALVGILAIVGGTVGQLLSGYIVTRCKLSVIGIFKYCLALCFVAFAASFTFVYSCENVDFAGINTPYVESSDIGAGGLVSACNLECSCSDTTFNPVCGDDGITYYSSCYAARSSAIIHTPSVRVSPLCTDRQRWMATATTVYASTGGTSSIQYSSFSRY